MKGHFQQTKWNTYFEIMNKKMYETKEDEVESAKSEKCWLIQEIFSEKKSFV